MRVLQLNYSDIGGGAPRAVYRIHNCMRACGVDSQMLVDHATSGDWTVTGPMDRLGRLTVPLRSRIGQLHRYLLKSGNTILHSPAVLSSRWPASLNASTADIIHMHWVGAEMLSVADIARIEKPLVWTLHDMWAFCGAEHVSYEDRWRTGYRRDNRPKHEGGFDLNRWTWERKRKFWRRPIQIVTPSRWLAECVRTSALMRDWPVVVVPNALDTERWRPIEKRLARELLGLPLDEPLVLFGALGGGKAFHKGFDLLEAALRNLVGGGLHLVVFGQSAPKQPPDVGLPVHFAGHLHDDLSLRALYSAADVLVIPSRIDNLPNTGVEAMACGTPVVAFDTCGLSDIVDHLRTGYLARPFDTEDLARGIQWVLAANVIAGDAPRIAQHGEATEPVARGVLSIGARQRAVERFSCPVVATQYLDVYRLVLAR